MAVEDHGCRPSKTLPQGTPLPEDSAGVLNDVSPMPLDAEG